MWKYIFTRQNFQKKFFACGFSKWMRVIFFVHGISNITRVNSLIRNFIFSARRVKSKITRQNFLKRSDFQVYACESQIHARKLHTKINKNSRVWNSNSHAIIIFQSTLEFPISHAMRMRKLLFYKPLVVISRSKLRVGDVVDER